MNTKHDEIRYFLSSGVASRTLTMRGVSIDRKSCKYRLEHLQVSLITKRSYGDQGLA